MRLRPVATWLPVVALGCAAWFAWAAIVRSDQWSAQPFVLLLYGLWLLTVLFVVAAGLALHRNEGALPAAARELGFVVLLLALLTVLWVWSPWLQPLVAWCVRRSSNLRFR
jgi:hypothetical protein